MRRLRRFPVAGDGLRPGLSEMPTTKRSSPSCIRWANSTKIAPAADAGDD